MHKAGLSSLAIVIKMKIIIEICDVYNMRDPHLTQIILNIRRCLYEEG